MAHFKHATMPPATIKHATMPPATLARSGIWACVGGTAGAVEAAIGSANLETWRRLAHMWRLCSPCFWRRSRTNLLAAAIVTLSSGGGCS